MPDTKNNIAHALVLEEFGKPFQLREFPLSSPNQGEVLVKITAAGVCGSDIHVHAGHDPRVPLPIILGHEGVGEVVAAGEGAALRDDGELKPGTPIVWERSLICGRCYFCQHNQRYLCADRKIYGINISSADPPHLSGNYATHILLRKGTSIYQSERDIDPAVLVAATCSGATAAHSHEYAGMSGGETVAIYGSGPLAAFQAAFAMNAGAKCVIVITRTPGIKSDIISEFGVDEVLFRSQMDSCKIMNYIEYQTNKIGADIIIDTTPDPINFREAVQMLRRGGVYINAGLAIPAEPVPVDFYSEIVNKNITIHGVWASDASHLEKSIALVKSAKFPFKKLITHRFKLEEHEEAWRTLLDKQAMKVVFIP